jgi:hypothetical protein
VPYTYDVIVLEPAVKHVAKTAEGTTTVASQIGLTIDVFKPKYVINKKKETNQKELK